MKVSIVKIGNSKGIRLSKSILDQYNITDAVEMIFEKGQIIIQPVSEPRKGWEHSFKQMAENEDDQLFIDDVFDDEEHEEWK